MRMKRSLLSWAAILLFVLGFGCWALLAVLENMRDVRGYLPQNVPVYYVILLFALLGVILPQLFGRKIAVTGYRKGGKRSSAVLLGLLYLLAVLNPRDFETKWALEILWMVCGFAAVLSYFAKAWLQGRGKAMDVPFRVFPALFLLLNLICHYQVWCNTPQFVTYLFPLLCNVSILLLLYQACAVTVELSPAQKLCGPLLMTLFFAAAGQRGSMSIATIAMLESLDILFDMEAKV